MIETAEASRVNACNMKEKGRTIQILLGINRDNNTNADQGRNGGKAFPAHGDHAFMGTHKTAFSQSLIGLGEAFGIYGKEQRRKMRGRRSFRTAGQPRD